MAYEDGVFATFYDDAILNKFKSKKAGDAVWDDVVMLRIQVPNQVDSVPRPATDADKSRFPKSWQAYETGIEPTDDGHPVKDWPELAASERKVLEACNIKTVEQLAELADAGLHRLGTGGQGLKTRAQKFLKKQNKIHDLEKQNKELQERLESVEGQLKEQEDAKPVAPPEVEQTVARQRFTA